MRRLSGRRTARHETGEYLIDGPVLLAEALDSGVEIRRLYVETAALDHPIVERVGHLAQVRQIADGVLARVLDVVNPNGMVAVAPIAPTPVEDLVVSAVDQWGVLLVLDGVSDPGNAGTLLRAAEASGCCGVMVTGESTDPYSPKVVRASAGSLFRIPLAVEGDTVGTLTGLREAGIRTWATVVRGGAAPEDVDLSGPCAVVVGSEAHGLDPALVERCSGLLSIPMAGSVESLNVAMAATVILFEAARQRRVAGRGDLRSG